MQGFSDDEREQLLREVLVGELEVILGYVQVIPDIKVKLHEIDERLIRVEKITGMVICDIKQL